MPPMTATEKVLRSIVIGGIFVLPAVALVIANFLFFPYITGKNFMFRILVEIMAGAWLALAVAVPKYRPRRDWVIGAFFLFVILIAIADAQGAMPFKSFWSNFERMDGWITVAHTFLFALVAACVLEIERLWRQLFRWSLWVSAYLSVLGFLQVASVISFGGGSGNSGLEGRIDTTFGNPIYLAVYMLFNVFIAALLWYQEGRENWSTRERWWYVAGIFGAYILVASQLPAGATVILFVFTALFFGLMLLGMLAPRAWVFGATMLLDTFALLFTATRGATIGLIGGAFLAFVIYALSRGSSARLRKGVVGALAVLIVFGAGLWLARDSALVQRIGFLDRLASISLSDDTTMARLINIQIAWKGIEERPILGWGQENFAIVFDKYYDPRMYAQEQWFDRVHNIVFDWWIAGGTLGLLSYLSIFAAALWALWRKGVFAPAERAILTGLLAGYFAQNLTVFDNVTSYILFAMVLGYLSYRVSAARGTPLLYAGEIVKNKALPILALVALAVVGWSVWAINAPAYAANRDTLAAISPQQGGVEDNLHLFEQAISYGTYGTQEAREQLSQAAVQITQTSGVSDSVRQAYVQTAVEQLDLQAIASPLDARFPLFAGTVLESTGDYQDASSELQRAHALSPNKQTILFSLAQNAQSLGDTAGMLADFKEAYELDTEDTDALLYYAAALIGVGQETQAQALLAPLIESGKAADSRIAAAYAARGEYSKLIPIWLAHIKADPSDAQGYFTLAAIYYAAHDPSDSIATLKTAGTAIPSVQTQAQQYIQEIQTRTVPTH